MKRWLLFFLLTASLRADELADGQAALADRLPAVAELKARAVLRLDEDSQDARRLLARALAERGDTAGALAELGRLKDPSDEDRLWRATLHEKSGNLDLALEEFSAVAERPDPATRRAAVLGRAGVLHRLGRFQNAESELEAWRRNGPDPEAQLMLVRLLLDQGKIDRASEELAGVAAGRPADRAWKAYLQGRIALLDGNAEEARTDFQTVLHSEHALTVELSEAANLGIAQAFLGQGEPEAATDALEDYINSLDDDRGRFGPAFDLLDVAYASAFREVPRQLEKWADKDPSPRTTLALFYLARAEMRHEKLEKAEQHLENFLTAAPAEHPLRLEAKFIRAQILIRQEKWDGALASIEETLAEKPPTAMEVRVRMLGGWVRFQQRAFDAAADFFSTAASLGGKPDMEQALFDTALSRLNAHDQPGFLEAYRAFSETFPESPLRSDLVFEQGILAARAGEKNAAETLRRFTADFPNNANVARARLALAETAWLAGQPAESSEYLRVALESDDREVQAKAEVMKIFQGAESDDPAQQAQALREGRKFLEEHAQSELVPDVRMKLGEIYFRDGDYGNARTQFEILARDHAKSPYAEPALFLAGQAAARSMNPEQALELFEQVARSESPLKLNARAEQARLKSQLGVDEEAVVLYDSVLNGAPDLELRFAALIGKAMSLVQLGEKDPARFDEAQKVFDEVISSPEATPAWRNEALYRKGKLLQALGRTDEALAAFYDALSRTISSPAEAEVFWFYRAGSEAARMLEQMGEFRGAVTVYDKLAAIQGPRSDEMKERKEKLQLEHFLWDEEPVAKPVE